MTQASVVTGAADKASISRMEQMRQQLLLSFIAALVVLQIQIKVSTAANGNDRISTALYTLYAAGLSVVCIKYFLRNAKTVLTTPAGATFLVYLLWITASVIWSINKFETLLLSSPLYLALFLSISFADIRPKLSVTYILLVACFVAILSWPVALIFPSFGTSRPFNMWRLQGIMIYCQPLSLFMSLAGLCLVLARFRGELDIKFQDRRFWFVALLIGATALATKARAFTTFAIVALVVTFYVSFSRKAKIALVLFVAAVIFFIATHPQILIDIYQRGGAEDLTLSGRVGIWISSLAKIRHRPWLGYGFASFSPQLVGNFFSDYVPPHAHNTWIQAAFETGIIGAILVTIFMGTIVVTGILYYRRYHKPNYSLVLMIFAAFCGLTGVVFGYKLVPSAGLILLLAVQEAYQARLMSRQRRKIRATTSLKGRRMAHAPQVLAGQPDSGSDCARAD